jgi:hypothetical protein
MRKKLSFFCCGVAFSLGGLMWLYASRPWPKAAVANPKSEAKPVAPSKKPPKGEEKALTQAISAVPATKTPTPFELYPATKGLGSKREPHHMEHIKRTLELLNLIKESKAVPEKLEPIQEALISCVTDTEEGASRQATCLQLLVEIDPNFEAMYLDEMQPAAQKLWLELRELTKKP